MDKVLINATTENLPFVIRDVANSGSHGDYKIAVHGEAKQLFWKYMMKKVNYPENCQCRIELDLSEVETLIELSLFCRYPNEYDNSKFYFEDNSFPVTSVILPETVTFIDECAFAVTTRSYNTNSYLESINIPPSVQFIAASAFENCTNLQSITIPGSVAFIAPHAFSGCESLKTVDIAEGVKSIAAEAFKGCISLETIKIPSSVTKIAAGVFDGCESLKTVDIAEGVKSIAAGAFKGCTSLETIKIPSSVKEIGEHAFYNCESHLSIIYAGTKSQWNKINTEGLYADYYYSKKLPVTLVCSDWKATVCFAN